MTLFDTFVQQPVALIPRVSLWHNLWHKPESRETIAQAV